MAKIADSSGSQTGEALKFGYEQKLVWEGTTTDNVATELFLRSKDNPASGGRLLIPNNSVIVGQGLFVAYNDTDNAVLCSGRFAISTTNLAGTVAASGATLEWDAAATDANPFINYFVGSAGLAIAYNNTLDAITVTVTGTAARVVRWRVELTDVIAL
jgi:hypothetical protein